MHTHNMSSTYETRRRPSTFAEWCAAHTHCHPVPAEEDVSYVMAIDAPAASAVRSVRRARAQARARGRARVCMTAAGCMGARCMGARGARRVVGLAAAWTAARTAAWTAAWAAAWAAAAGLGALDLGLDLALDLGLEILELGLLLEVVPVVEHVEDVIELDDVLVRARDRVRVRVRVRARVRARARVEVRVRGSASSVMSSAPTSGVGLALGLDLCSGGPTASCAAAAH